MMSSIMLDDEFKKDLMRETAVINKTKKPGRMKSFMKTLRKYFIKNKNLILFIESRYKTKMGNTVSIIDMKIETY